MPVVVDKARVRQDMVEVAARLIADEGLTALSARRVAEATGVSRAFVPTYFENMRNLLIATFQHGAKRAADRFEAARAGGGSLQACLETLLPLDEESTTYWRVTLAFLGAAAADGELAKLEEEHFVSASRRIESILLKNRDLRRSTRSTQSESRELLALVVGLSVMATYDTGMAPARVRMLLGQGLARHS